MVGNLSIHPNSTARLGSIPFIFKLGISVAVDFVGLGFAASVFTGIGIPLAIGYAVLQAFLCILLWNDWTASVLIATAESIPVLNAIPSMTIICLWTGYKTGWRY